MYGYVPKYATCGDCGVATSKVRLEILYFKYFNRHMVFERNIESFKNKKVKQYFNVSVVVDIECGDTK
ncbi:TPA: hypothetical protein KOR91_003395 [Clostridioides difficile]|nr:conserved hypothetical protein [Clostridioides difficile E25]HBE9684201.1 hypothetical protein [Clostridioides difficile]HBF1898467.1 hypothetical protein [Clostridioides difficile]HBF2152547.1 hypothetical protein [Clostridioides difficile]HBF3217522.1 hypothetical protein [Clostridioides difficile]